MQRQPGKQKSVTLVESDLFQDIDFVHVVLPGSMNYSLPSSLTSCQQSSKHSGITQHLLFKKAGFKRQAHLITLTLSISDAPEHLVSLSAAPKGFTSHLPDLCEQVRS